jgi:hypothetical protein
MRSKSGCRDDSLPPQCFASIRENMENAQRAEGAEEADVDCVFEIPLEVAQALVGFKHDESYESVVEGNFVVLSGGKTKKSFFSRLFEK